MPGLVDTIRFEWEKSHTQGGEFKVGSTTTRAMRRHTTQNPLPSDLSILYIPLYNDPRPKDKGNLYSYLDVAIRFFSTMMIKKGFEKGTEEI